MRSVLDGQPVAELLPRLPPALRSLAAEPPDRQRLGARRPTSARSSTRSRSSARLHARGRARPGSAVRNRALFTSPVYRVLMSVASPEALLRHAGPALGELAPRHARSGSRAFADEGVGVTLAFPVGLFDGLLVAAYGAAFAAALEVAHAQASRRCASTRPGPGFARYARALVGSGRVQRAKLTGIVLRTVDTGESDRVVTLLSRERGKVAAFARGARASRRRFGGSLEPFTLVTAEVRERPARTCSGSTRSRRCEAFGGIRGDLARIACAALRGGAVARARPRSRAARGALRPARRVPRARSTRRRRARPALRAFELGALRAAGLLAAARRLRPLRRPARPGPVGPLRPGARRTPLRRVRAARLPGRAVALAAPRSPRSCASPRAGSPPPTRSALAPPAGREARDALGAFVEHHLGHRLQARRFLEEIGPMLGE